MNNRQLKPGDAPYLGIFLALCAVVTFCFIVGLVAVVREMWSWF